MVESSYIGILVLIFISLSLFVGSLTRHLLKRTNIPYTVALLLIGLLAGLGGKALTESNPTNLFAQINTLAAQIDPKLILFIFLPILIFESAFSLDVHLFRRLFTKITILAVPALVVCITLTATLVHYLFPSYWTWPICLMFASLISATDPVAVVALLKEIGAGDRLKTLIEGESLLNDGTAIVFFSIFYLLATSPELSFSFSNVVTQFFIVALSGAMIGALIGFITVIWWGWVFNDPMIEISLSIVSAILSFLIAEHGFHVSGVVAVVTCAIVLAGYGSTQVSPEVSGFLHRFWGMMGFIAETIIFLLVGIVIGHRVSFDDPNLWMTLGILYVCLMLVRALAIALFYPILHKMGGRFDVSKAVVLTWGGLRGVVGLTLALAVIQDPRISTQLGDQILFLTAGIVILTIVINGSSMLWLIKKLGLDKLSMAKFLTVRRAKCKIEDGLRAYYPTLKENELLKEAHWDEVESLAGLDYVMNKEDIAAEAQALLKVQEEDLARACRRRILETERKCYWTQLHSGMLGNTATRLLVKEVDHALDDDPVIHPRPTLDKYWELPNMVVKLTKAPLISKLFIHYSFYRFSIGYEVAKGFLYAQDEMIKFLPAISHDLETEKQIKKEILKNKEMTYQRIEQMRSTFPDILSQLETYAACRSMLYKKRYIIQQLVDSGLLNEAETKQMISHVEDKMQSIRTDMLHLSTKTEHED